MVVTYAFDIMKNVTNTFDAIQNVNKFYFGFFKCMWIKLFLQTYLKRSGKEIKGNYD